MEHLRVMVSEWRYKNASLLITCDSKFINCRIINGLVFVDGKNRFSLSEQTGLKSGLVNRGIPLSSIKVLRY